MGTQHIRCRIISRTQKGTLILTTTHIFAYFVRFFIIHTCLCHTGAHANTTPLCGGFCACVYVCVKISQPFNHGLFTNKYMQIQKKRDTDTDTARERERKILIFS